MYKCIHHHYLRQGCKFFFLICFVVSVLFCLKIAEARLVNDVTIETIDDGYQVTIHFEFQMRYQSHSPTKATDFARIEVRPVFFSRLDQLEIEFLRERIALAWDRETGIPIKELIYEGGDPKLPQITFLFTEKVEFDVRSSVDLRSLIVTIKTKAPPLSKEVKEVIPEEIEEKVIEEAVEALPEEVEIPEEKVELGVLEKKQKLEKLMEEAKAAMTEDNYSRAVQIYTKILRTADGDIRKQAQEFLGLARERNGQIAHAKAEYKKYLTEYPEGDDAERVRQRLAGLVTAAMKPKERIEEDKRPKKIVEKPKWQSHYFGNFSQFFFRDQTFREDGETQVNRNDLSNTLDLNSRWNSQNFEISSKFTGSYQNIFLPDDEDQERLNALSFAIRHKKSDLYGNFGRQSTTSGGVLGRFDGAHISYDITPKIVINGVLGFPVESTKQIEVETQRMFTGISADFGTFNEHWDYNVFFITQDNSGLTDRRAIGGEVSYFDPKKSFFTLLDYDVHFGELNIFLFNGNWTLPTKTTLNLVYDYRRAPLLTTNNAIQGQGVTELKDLFSRFTKAELEALAEDRSDLSKTVTFGITQELTDNTQLNGEFTVAQAEGTVASGGVEEIPGTGDEFFVSMQLINNNVFFENDSIINGLRYSDTSSRNTYTYYINSRIPFGRKLRIISKIRTDYRDDKDKGNRRWTVRPTMRVNYRLKKWIRFEVEGGVEWMNHTSSGISTKSTQAFGSIGYRITF